MKSSQSKVAIVALLIASTASAACQQKAAEPAEQAESATISESDANQVVDTTLVAWQSMDAAKIDALYSPDVVGFDVAVPDLSTDRANWTKIQQGFADMKFDKVDVTARKLQILDGEDFILSTMANVTSSTGPTKAASIRCTDVFRKQADGKFLIVNEHCSAVPVAPAKASA
jgi:ketosteroid isomerase-like protein